MGTENRGFPKLSFVQQEYARLFVQIRQRFFPFRQCLGPYVFIGKGNVGSHAQFQVLAAKGNYFRQERVIAIRRFYEYLALAFFQYARLHPFKHFRPFVFFNWQIA